MKSLLPILIFLGLSASVAAQNAIPQVENLTVIVDDVNKEITISFDLTDAEDDLSTISLQASVDGRNYGVDVSSATGDIGNDIATGMGKSITLSTVGLPAGALRIRVIADDNVEVDIQSIVDQVDSMMLIEHMSFVEGIRHRNTGVALLEAVKDSLDTRFAREGLSVVREPVPFGAYTGENIIGTTSGIQNWNEVYIVGGHFDTVSNSPGGGRQWFGYSGDI